MSEDSNRNSGFNAASAATRSVYQINALDQLSKALRDKMKSAGRGWKPDEQALEMLHKVPASHRTGNNHQAAEANLRKYLSDKDASHVYPHSKGGSAHPDNLEWESRATHRPSKNPRGDQPMTPKEQRDIHTKANVDNVSGAVQRGMEAGLKGAVIGAVTTLPFSFLRNALRVSRGEMTSQEAAMETGKETLMGGAVGGVTAFTVTAVASAFPPIAIFLTAVSPALLVVGGAGMVYEFFKILEDHKQEVRDYYNSLTEQQLSYLQQVEDEMIYEHKKNLRFLNEQRALSEEITNRPRRAGIEGAFERLQQSIAIAESMGLSGKDSKLLGGSTQRYLSANS